MDYGVEARNNNGRRKGSKTSVYAALAGNLLVAATKFVAAVFTGSAAMLSEGVHSLVDTGNEALLLYGMHRAALPPDSKSPMGHGRELYFWSFIVALLIFSLGACISLYQGVVRIISPTPIQHIWVSYAVIGLSALFEGGSWWIARKQFKHDKHAKGYLEAARRSKDPTTFTVLFEDSAALVGLLTAFVGIFLSHHLGRPVFDGIASVVIGIILACTAAFLMRETKGLLIGEQASAKLQDRITEIADNDKTVERANGVLTVHLGPDHVVVMLSVKFIDGAHTADIENSVQRIEEQARAEFPQVMTMLVKPQRTQEWYQRHQELTRGDRQKEQNSQ